MAKYGFRSELPVAFADESESVPLEAKVLEREMETAGIDRNARILGDCWYVIDPAELSSDRLANRKARIDASMLSKGSVLRVGSGCRRS